MDKRFRNLGIVIAAIVVFAILAFVVLPGIQLPLLQNKSFSDGLNELNAVVEKNNVPIERFRDGKLFWLKADTGIDYDFSDLQFLSLKNDLRSYKEKLPSAASSIDANALNQLANLYL